ncbi:hypothetical protein PLICRDRAFT_166690 [Plicaturopsis crispa FD-325 SS-3]|uniref:YebC-like protein n=1 Tax=Plicaturopsis crispa FD-325 SS-3 TaxID=944288 RepID=A0A0C9SLA4_PLICR|nr:hypothetical protein PLICRDRAFT_166690 [Plicaturopsis crispa FD-325 SS-3]
MGFGHARFLASQLRAVSLPRSFSTSPVHASGHNKWSKIKTKKGAADAKKSAVFGKAYRDIMVAVRGGGSADPGLNSALAAVLKNAKSVGVPKDNIEKALAKASSTGKDRGDQQVTYEAMAYGSVGVIVECLTDNLNRTAHNIRGILGSHGARLAPVGFLFTRRGYVNVSLDKGDDRDARTERLIEAALESGAEDFEEAETPDDPTTTELEFTCPTENLAKLTAAVTRSGLSRDLLSSELVYAPVDKPESADEDLETKVAELVGALEDNEDTLRVWTTLDS